MPSSSSLSLSLVVGPTSESLSCSGEPGIARRAKALPLRFGDEAPDLAVEADFAEIVPDCSISTDEWRLAADLAEVAPDFAERRPSPSLSVCELASLPESSCAARLLRLRCSFAACF